MRLFYSCLMIILSCFPLEASSPLQFVGLFSNMNRSSDHQYGEDVYLWKDGEGLCGYIYYSLGGALGDETMARLEKLQFEPKTGKLSFEARNPVYDEKGSVIRNLFVFDGQLRSDSIEGTLRCQGVDGNACLPDKKITWKKLRVEMGNFQPIYKDAWEKKVVLDLEERGARW